MKSKIDLILVVILIMIVATGVAEIISWQRILSDLAAVAASAAPEATLTRAAGEWFAQLTARAHFIRLTQVAP